MFGLVGRKERVIQKLGLHCTNVCTMRQGMSLSEWKELTQEELRRGIHFCADCSRELAQYRTRFKKLPPG